MSSKSKKQQSHHLSSHCTQEPRLAYVEAGLNSLSEIMKDVRDLLQSSIRSEERVTTLQTAYKDQETRLRRVETTQAGARWIERVVWLIVAAGIALVLKFKDGGGQP